MEHTTQAAARGPKAIDTLYRGFRFRSRLEARWAVFFDQAKVKWLYEDEGYQLPSGWYLPDFYLPDYRIFAEIKPDGFFAHEAHKSRETRLAEELAYSFPDTEDRVVLMFSGDPIAAIPYEMKIRHGLHAPLLGLRAFSEHLKADGNQRRGALAARAARFEHGARG